MFDLAELLALNLTVFSYLLGISACFVWRANSDLTDRDIRWFNRIIIIWPIVILVIIITFIIETTYNGYLVIAKLLKED